MSLLICTVGTRDLTLAGSEKPLRQERTWAAAVQNRYPEVRAQLQLPIIGKALHYLAACATLPTHVVLIASDQPAPPQGDATFWADDTCVSAAVIARLLSDGYAGLPPVPAAQTQIWTIGDAAGRGGDPSDYDLVPAFLERRLPELLTSYPHGPVFLEVTGGTPAMTTGLLIAGTEIFGSRTELLSIHPRRATPVALGAGRRLLAAPLRATLRSNAATYAYDAALRTVQTERATIGDRLPPAALATIEPLLSYAHCRYNFDFPGARAALETAPAAAPWANELRELAEQVQAPTRRDLLAEVFHGSAARYDSGLYADFLTQLVRFEENALRLLCLERGVVFRTRDGQADADGSLICRTWLQTQPFTLSRDRNDGRDLPNSRSVMRELVGALARSSGGDLSDLLGALDQLQALVYLRNELTHSLDGVRKAELAARFRKRRNAPAEDADRIVPHLAALYERVAGRAVPPSPFAAINRLLAQLLQPERA